MAQVSYNGGAHWHLLKKPQTFKNPGCDTCSKLNSSWECQLHLHGPSSWHATAGGSPPHYAALLLCAEHLGCAEQSIACVMTCRHVSRTLHLTC